MSATTYTDSGVWYCQAHSGTVNEDEGHDADDRCPWHEHDDDRCGDPMHDPDPDYEWCDGACSPCDWVELLIPSAAEVPTATLAQAVHDAIRAGDDLCVVDLECLLIDAKEWLNESDSEVAERLRGDA